MDFSRLITEKKTCQDVRENEVNVSLACCRTSQTIRHLGEMFNATGVQTD